MNLLLIWGSIYPQKIILPITYCRPHFGLTFCSSIWTGVTISRNHMSPCNWPSVNQVVELRSKWELDTCWSRFRGVFFSVKRGASSAGVVFFFRGAEGDFFWEDSLAWGASQRGERRNVWERNGVLAGGRRTSTGGEFSLVEVVTDKVRWRAK